MSPDLIQGSKAPAATGTPEPLSATSLSVRRVMIQAHRAARAANAGNVWLGTTSTNDAQLWRLQPWETLTIEGVIEDGIQKEIDLSTIYVDAETLTDGVAFIAQ